jgi:predicted  nucleic acid-binding Zn-ribbon protein
MTTMTDDVITTICPHCRELEDALARAQRLITAQSTRIGELEDAVTEYERRLLREIARYEERRRELVHDLEQIRTRHHRSPRRTDPRSRTEP